MDGGDGRRGANLSFLLLIPVLTYVHITEQTHRAVVVHCTPYKARAKFAGHQGAHPRCYGATYYVVVMCAIATLSRVLLCLSIVS